MAATALESLTFSQSVAYRWRSSCSRGQPVCTYRCVFVCVLSAHQTHTDMSRLAVRRCSSNARPTARSLRAVSSLVCFSFRVIARSFRFFRTACSLWAAPSGTFEVRFRTRKSPHSMLVRCLFFFCFRFRFADTCRRQRSRASSTEYVVSCRAASLLTVLSLVADETKNEFTSTSFQLVTEYNSSKLNPIGDDLDIVGIEAHKPSAEHRRLREYYEPNETLPTRGVWSAKASDPFF